MKRLAVFAASVIAFAVLATPVSASSDNTGPACTDIVFGDFGYSTSGLVSGSVDLVANACSFATYTLSVYTVGAGGSTTGAFIGSSEVSGASVSGPNVPLSFQLSGTLPATVCLVVTSGIGPHHIADRAPNLGPNGEEVCVPVDISQGGEAGFN